MNIPTDLKYTKDHEWVKIENDILVIGITDFAQGELGDIVYVEVETLNENLNSEEVLELLKLLRQFQIYLCLFLEKLLSITRILLKIQS